MNQSTYQLNPFECGQSKNFYKDLQQFTNDFLEWNEVDELRTLLQSFKRFITHKKIETLRTENEYLIELLQLGVFWKVYISSAMLANPVLTKTLRNLYRSRSIFPVLKPNVDRLRGRLQEKIIITETQEKHYDFTSGNFLRLLNWLEASGEFKEEAKRLKNWHSYFSEREALHIASEGQKILQLGNSFEKLARQNLGIYTQGVDLYLRISQDFYRNQENNIFGKRKVVEYHLNMVCAEILNRAYRLDFEKTIHKVVLVPTCMRPMDAEGKCKAQKKDNYYICQKCDSDCHIYQLTKHLTSGNHQVCLIPHSSGFSKILRNWANSESTGLVGVACVLNLLRGGYEMKNLNIPAQCVFLDYSGCRKHWKPIEKSTRLNVKQLRVLMDEGKLEVSKIISL